MSKELITQAIKRHNSGQTLLEMYGFIGLSDASPKDERQEWAIRLIENSQH